MVMLNEYRPHKDRPLSECKDVEKTLIYGTQVLERLGVNYWICAGTALGFHRDKDFIDRDTDIDVGVEANWYNPFLHGLAERIIREMCGMKLLQTQYEQGRPMQIAFIDDNNVIFDIYFYYTNYLPDKVINFNINGQMVMPYKLFMKKDMIKTKYGEFPFPSPIEDFLTIRYGEDWRTPKNDKGIFIP
jgi:hypothetical protein